MAAARVAKARVARRKLPLAVKRRNVDPTLSPGASVVEIARTHALYPNIVHRWRRLYRAGEFDAQSTPTLQSGSDAMSAMFVPVRVVSAVRQLRAAVQRQTVGVLQQRYARHVGLAFRAADRERCN